MKIARQMAKDYLVFSAVRRSRWRRTHGRERGRECCAHSVGVFGDFCAHFADGAEKFTAAAVEEESKPDWYIRQMLGTANFNVGPLLAFASGNLCYQFEHHLFPDLRSNRYAQIATRVRALCGQVRPSLHHRLAAGPVSADGTDHP